MREANAILERLFFWVAVVDFECQREVKKERGEKKAQKKELGSRLGG